MQTRIVDRKFLYQFDSLAEMQRWVDETPRTAWRYKTSSESTPAGTDWDLGLGYAGAQRLARDGWLEGAQRIQEALQAFPPRDPAPNLRNDFYGHMPHVARYCAGAPDSMVRYTTDDANSGSGRIVTIYVAIGTGMGSAAEYMVNYGIAIAQYINQLEQQGRRVELYAANYSGDYPGGSMGICWRVKSADQPIDLAVLAFSLGHPAAFRRIGFAALERTAISPKPGGYGVPCEIQASHFIDPPAGAYFLNGMKRVNSLARTPEDAFEYVSKHIGIALETDAD